MPIPLIAALVFGVITAWTTKETRVVYVDSAGTVQEAKVSGTVLIVQDGDSLSIRSGDKAIMNPAPISGISHGYSMSSVFGDDALRRLKWEERKESLKAKESPSNVEMP